MAAEMRRFDVTGDALACFICVNVQRIKEFAHGVERLEVL